MALAGRWDSLFEERSTRWSKAEQGFFVVAVALLLVSLPFFVHPWYDRTNDGSTYIITARSIAAGEGYTYLGAPFLVRAPGFATLVALFAGDEAGMDFAGLNWMVSVFGAVGVALLHLHLRAHLGWMLALATACVVWLNPGYQQLCNQVMSDVPGLALALACLLLGRWASRVPSWRREIVLGLAIGLVSYVRSATILLVPAIVVARVLERALGRGNRSTWAAFLARRTTVVAAVAWIALLPWSVTKWLEAPPPPADQTLNYSISTAMWHEDPGDPSSPRYSALEILRRIPERLHDTAIVVGSRMQHEIPGSPSGPLAQLTAGSLMGVCLLIVLLRRRAPAEIFACALLTVTGVYFVFTDRLALPLFVFALAATVEVGRDFVRRFAGSRVAAVVMAAGLSLLVAIDFAPRRDWARIAASHRDFVELAAAVEGVLEPDARLAAAQGFHYGVYLGRPVYNLMHAVRRAGRPDAAEQIIDRYGIDTVVLSPLVPADTALVPYFEERYGPGTPAGFARVWRVRQRARPHIVLITSDTLRADHLSLNGYPRATSPAIDAFAARARHFPDAVTVIPKTAPSFATIFTGRHPQQHGARSNFDAIPPALPVLAEHLRALGYRTAAFVGNPVLRPGLGFDRGFEQYRLFDGKRGEGVASVNKAFLEWAEGLWDRPSFVWIHYMDPHGPYTPPDELLRPFLEDELARSDERVPLEAAELPSGNPDKVLGAIPAYQRLPSEDRVAVYVARYDAEIRLVDAAFAELMAFLERRELYDRSAVVFTSDHGESLGEHDYYFEHGWFAFDTTLRVPLLIKPPVERAGRVVGGQVSNLDLYPTLLGLAGAPPDGGVSGADLLQPLAERPPLLIESSDGYPDKYHGVRTSAWKYLVRASDRAEELHDLRADPGELRNLAVAESGRLAELRRAYEEALLRARESAVPRAAGSPDDPETLERLKALGYVAD